MEIDLLAKVRQRVTEDKLADSGDVVVVAVSGGPDSVALLHVLFALTTSFNWKLVIAHVNHQFRGAESDAEASFVKELAKELNLPCEIGVIDVPAYIEETSLNGQAAAREKRYEFLHQVAAEYGAQRIAFAHHADDFQITARTTQRLGTSGDVENGIGRNEFGSQRRAGGIDEVQALLLALEQIGIRLSETEEYKQGHLSWIGSDERNLGFPHLDSAGMLLVYIPNFRR